MESNRERYRKEAANQTEQLASIHLELDEPRIGEEGKTLAVASIAAAIIFIAHHGIEVRERHGSAVDGREVIAKDFLGHPLRVGAAFESQLYASAGLSIPESP